MRVSMHVWRMSLKKKEIANIYGVCSTEILLCDEMHLWCKICQGSTLRATPGKAPLHNPLHHLIQPTPYLTITNTPITSEA